MLADSHCLLNESKILFKHGTDLEEGGGGKEGVREGRRERGSKGAREGEKEGVREERRKGGREGKRRKRSMASHPAASTVRTARWLRTICVRTHLQNQSHQGVVHGVGWLERCRVKHCAPLAPTQQVTEYVPSSNKQWHATNVLQ